MHKRALLFSRLIYKSRIILVRKQTQNKHVKPTTCEKLSTTCLRACMNYWQKKIGFSQEVVFARNFLPREKTAAKLFMKTKKDLFFFQKLNEGPLPTKEAQTPKCNFWSQRILIQNKTKLPRKQNKKWQKQPPFRQKPKKNSKTKKRVISRTCFEQKWFLVNLHHFKRKNDAMFSFQKSEKFECICINRRQHLSDSKNHQIFRAQAAEGTKKDFIYPFS